MTLEYNINTGRLSNPLLQPLVPDSLDQTLNQSLEDNPLLAAPKRPFVNPNSKAVRANEGFKLLDLDDAILAPLRGIDSFARSAIDLGGALLGHNPRVSEGSTFGKSDSILGGFLEGATQFFIPFSALKAIELPAKIIKVMPSMLVRGAEAITGGGAKFIADGVTSGVAELVAFSGHQERLANLVERIPGASNVVTRYLQNEIDDSELEGRLKGLLEGVAINLVLLKPLVASVKAAARGLAALHKTADIAALGKELRGIFKETEESMVKAEEAVADEVEKAAKETQLNALDEDGKRIQTDGNGDPIDSKELVKRGQQALKEAEAETQRNKADLKARKQAFEAEQQKRIAELKSERDKALSRAIDKLGDRERGILSKLMKPKSAILAEDAEAFLDELTEDDLVFLRKLGVDRPSITPAIRGLISMAHRHDYDPVKAAEHFKISGVSTDEFISFFETLQETFDHYFKEAGRKHKIGVGVFERSANEFVSGVPFHQLTSEEQERILKETLVQPAERSVISALVFSKLEQPLLKRLVTLVDLHITGTAKKSALDRYGYHELKDNPAALKDEMHRLLISLQHLARSDSIVGTLQGHALNLRKRRAIALGKIAKFIVDPQDSKVTTPAEFLEKFGSKEFNQRMSLLRAVMEMDDPDRIETFAHLVDRGRRGILEAAVAEHAISSMLWSPRSVVTNAVFPFMTAFMVPFENIVGGLLTGNIEKARVELDTIAGQVAAIPRMFSIFKRALRDGARLDPSATKRIDIGFAGDVLNAETLEKLGFENWGPGTVFGMMAHTLGRFDSIPGRFFAASDEAVKWMVAQGYGAALARREARAIGADPAAYVPDRLKKMFSEGHLVTEELVQRRVDQELTARVNAGIDIESVREERSAIEAEIRKNLSFEEINPITTEVLARGREVTATAPLVKGGGIVDDAAIAIQTLAKNHPIVRLVAPFTTTTTNILKFVGQRNPLAALPAVFRRLTGHDELPPNILAAVQRNTRELLSGDADKFASAVGRLATGTGIMATVATAAYSGMFTGSGPDDPELRNLLLDAGWQPYSIRIGDAYYSYLRADPIALMIGLAADTVETAKLNMAQANSTDFEAVMMGILSSVANNVTDRSYLTGISMLLEAIGDPQRNGQRLVATTLSQGIPRIFTQIGFMFQDPVLRDTYGLLNKLRQKTPFMGAPPLRNMFGEPIRQATSLGAPVDSPAGRWLDMFDPIVYREVTDDEVRKELANLNHGFTPPPRKVMGIELTDFRTPTGQDAYDRWQELQGKVRIGGVTLKQAMKRLIRSRAYQRLPFEADALGASPRVSEITKLRNRYRQAAFAQLQKELPDLAQALKQEERYRRDVAAGHAPPRATGSPFILP